MSEENKAPEPLAAGSTAPDFTLPARSGKSISLHDFAGQKDVLIYFYPKDDTPGCTREACSLRDGWADLAKAGIEVLGISRDDAASHNAFAAKYNLPFELLSDPDHAVHEKYGAWGPNPNPAWGVGPLRKSFLVGKSGKIRRVFDKVDTEHHAEQVLRAAGFTPAARPLPAPAAAPPAATVAPPAPKPAAPTVSAVADAARTAVATAVAKVAETVEKAAVAVEKAAIKTAAPAAPKAAAAKKAVKKAVRKAVRRVKKAITKAKVKKAVRKVKKAVAKAKVKKAVRKVKKAAPKKKTAKRTARRPARKAARKVKRTVRKAKRAAPKRKAKKAAKRKKR